MTCFLGCLAFFAPRLALVAAFFLSDILDAYETLLWPVLGFLFLPLTTLAYAWALHTNGSVEGIYLAIVVLAVLADLGIVRNARQRRRLREHD